MTEDTSSKVTNDAGSNPGAATTRQRKKRKWDQPAESVLSAGVHISGMVSFAGTGAFPGIGLPGAVSPLVGMIASGAMTSGFMAVPQNSLTTSLVQQNAAAIVQKINQDLATKGLLPQPKIQDELIAREIVINDADPTVRYKLTKRQTQEEIQAKTGAVVITRGKYRSPNGPIENEKPLYLHISAGSHLKETGERIKAVDQAALMVEEILKQGRQPQSASTLFSPISVTGGLVTSPFSTAVYVGLEADLTLNLVSQIRGPNDQYINHIMNETGATVVLRGRGCGNYEGPLGEEVQQPLHLFISSDNAKSLEDAKSLADNLLETVRAECLKSRPQTYQVGSAANMPTASMQSSILSYPVPSYSISSVGAGPYAGVYPQAGVSFTQTHASSLQSLSSANTYTISSSIPQPGSVNTANLMATEINKLSSTRVYNAVPPPQQLLAEGTVTKADAQKSEISSAESPGVDGSLVTSSSIPNGAISLPATASSGITTQQNSAGTGVFGTLASSTNAQNLATTPTGLPLSYGQPTSSSYPQVQQTQQTQPSHAVSAPAGTTYIGYGGIYPQATPLQQVALALQRPPPPVSVKPGPFISTHTPTKLQSSYSNGQSEKPAKRRKFQELPVVPKESSRDNQNLQQGTDISNIGDLSEELSAKKQCMPPPKSVPMAPPKGIPSALSASMPPLFTKSMPPPSSQNMPSSSSKSMPPPFSRSMPPPPPPQAAPPESISNSKLEDSFHHETSLKLVEYGEEDDDDLGFPGTTNSNGTQYANGKPFWAP